MKNIIIVSKCVRVSSYSSEENTYYFHFKGVFAGDLLKEVVLQGREEFGIRRGEEYLIYVQMTAIENAKLEERSSGFARWMNAGIKASRR